MKTQQSADLTLRHAAKLVTFVGETTYMPAGYWHTDLCQLAEQDHSDLFSTKKKKRCWKQYHEMQWAAGQFCVSQQVKTLNDGVAG